MNFGRLALSGLLLAWVGSLAHADVPRIFVVQLVENPKDHPEYESLLLDSYVAAALDELGQVDPIVWSMADPRFRQIADTRGFALSLQSPSQSEIVNVSRSIGAEYVLVVWAMRSATIVRPVATLYRNNGFKSIWRYGDWDRRLAPFFNGTSQPLNELDLKNFQNTYGKEVLEIPATLVGGEPDWDSTSRTIAATWAFMLRQGPLEKLPLSPRRNLPEADPGAMVPLPTGVNLPDVRGGIAGVEALLEKGQTELAIVQLRDLIDKEPFEDSYRLKLTSILATEGLYIEAAREAIRGAQVSNKPLPFYQLGAKNWLRAGLADQARDALNNILARGGENRETDYMMGQYYLRTGDYTQSIEWYSKAIRYGPTPEIVYERGVAFAFAGQPDFCLNDLASLVDLPSERLTVSYEMMVGVCEDQFEGIGVRLGDRIPLLKVRKDDAEMIAYAARDNQMAKGLAVLMELTLVPPQYKVSHESRLLAHKLLFQSTTEVFEFATTRKEDLATEGLISLREAMKLLPRMRKLFEADQSSHSG
ncbi:MAG: tetratricopeptide repeat protein [Fimbriimonadaceae bacterium]